VWSVVSLPRRSPWPAVALRGGSSAKAGCQSSVVSIVPSALRELLVKHLDSLVDYLAREPVDGQMDPVMRFPFHDEIVLEALRT
jgi:hypothetical protein